MNQIPQTPLTTLKRLPKRGSHERETINQILDEGFICHVGFGIEGQPFVIPTGYARADDKLIIHGSQASRMLRALKTDRRVQPSRDHDGLAFGISSFDELSFGVIFGRATLIEDVTETRGFLPCRNKSSGRWRRRTTEAELQQTTVLSLPIDEASAKIRTGPPLDDESDYAMNVWAGVLPIQLTTVDPIADPRLPPNIKVPDYVGSYRRGK